MLTALNTSLDARIQELAATPDEGNSGQIQEQLSGVLQQLEQAQKDLASIFRDGPPTESGAHFVVGG